MTLKIKPGIGATHLSIGMPVDVVREQMGDPAFTEPVASGFERLHYPDQDISVIVQDGQVYRLFFGNGTTAKCGPIKMGMSIEQMPDGFTQVARRRDGAGGEIFFDVAGLTVFLHDGQVEGMTILPSGADGDEQEALVFEGPQAAPPSAAEAAANELIESIEDDFGDVEELSDLDDGGLLDEDPELAGSQTLDETTGDEPIARETGLSFDESEDATEPAAAVAPVAAAAPVPIDEEEVDAEADTAVHELYTADSADLDGLSLDDDGETAEPTAPFDHSHAEQLPHAGAAGGNGAAVGNTDVAGQADLSPAAVGTLEEEALLDSEPQAEEVLTAAAVVAPEPTKPRKLRLVDAPAGPAGPDDRRPMPRGGSLPINYLFDVKPGFGDEYLHLQMTEEEVSAQLGVPGGSRADRMRFAGRGIQVHFDGAGKVLAIVWCNEKSPLFLGPIRPSYAQVSGLRLGDPSVDILERIPEAEREDDFEAATGRYTLPGLEVEHVRGEVVQITVYPSGARPVGLGI